MINKQLLIGGIVGAIAVTAVSATAGYRMLNSDDYAEVLTVSEVTRTVSVPRDECRDQLVSVRHPTQDPNQIAGTVTGAVIGGVVGSQIGDGDGKKIATVAGAVAGGYSGKKVQEGMQDRNVDQVSQRVCETIQDSSQEQVGYDVTYLLDGQEQTVRMTDDPGRRIRIEDGEPVIE
ncbi:MAG: glycine zipper 2TM domain-containing protein [Woeseiaceae bacterium]|nr:glycine zipper 2TM domain-containing protein [Woeseiaceae bacterium]